MARELLSPVDLFSAVPKTGQINPSNFNDVLRERLQPIGDMGRQANDFAAQQAMGKDVQRQALQARMMQQAQGQNDANGGPMLTANGKWISPITGMKPTFDYAAQYKSGGMHHGMDFATASGTPIYAPAAGTLLSSGWGNTGFGNEIRAQFGQGGPFGIFGHLSKFAPGIKAGQQFTPGQLLGYVGSTGNSTGNHLHFELRKLLNDIGTSINPKSYFGW